MRSYGQYCPVAISSEVLGDRWSPLILREMVIGSTRFNDIERGLPGISRTLLAQRLRHLERKGVVERRALPSGRGSEYHLTEAGQALGPVLIALGEWSVRWFYAEPQPDEVDPTLVTWWLRRTIDPDQLPDRRVVVELNYDDPDERTVLWMVLEPRDQSVCVQHPGFDPDLVVHTDAVSMTRVFNGIDTFASAQRDGTVVIDGPPTLARGFRTWFRFSPFAPAYRRAHTARA